MRSPAAQCRLVPPCVLGTEPASVSGAFHRRRPAPLGTSTVQISHGRCRRASTESGSPPPAGIRTNAMRAPSGDQRGDRSRAKVGRSQRMGVASLVYTPTKACVPRLDTNASRAPSGDHRGSPFVPRAVKSALAGAEPSIGTVQICPPLVNATRSLRGESTGSSPSPNTTGSPPANGTASTCTLGGMGLCVTFTGTWSSQLEPWSPPRTYTTHRPSAETETLVSSCPSSVS